MNRVIDYFKTFHREKRYNKVIVKNIKISNTLNKSEMINVIYDNVELDFYFEDLRVIKLKEDYTMIAFKYSKKYNYYSDYNYIIR